MAEVAPPRPSEQDIRDLYSYMVLEADLWGKHDDGNGNIYLFHAPSATSIWFVEWQDKLRALFSDIAAAGIAADLSPPDEYDSYEAFLAAVTTGKVLWQPCMPTEGSGNLTAEALAVLQRFSATSGGAAGETPHAPRPRPEGGDVDNDGDEEGSDQHSVTSSATETQRRAFIRSALDQSIEEAGGAEVVRTGAFAEAVPETVLERSSATLPPGSSGKRDGEASRATSPDSRLRKSSGSDARSEAEEMLSSMMKEMAAMNEELNAMANETAPHVEDPAGTSQLHGRLSPDGPAGAPPGRISRRSSGSSAEGAERFKLSKKRMGVSFGNLAVHMIPHREDSSALDQEEETEQPMIMALPPGSPEASMNIPFEEFGIPPDQSMEGTFYLSPGGIGPEAVLDTSSPMILADDAGSFTVEPAAPGPAAAPVEPAMPGPAAAPVEPAAPAAEAAPVEPAMPGPAAVPVEPAPPGPAAAPVEPAPPAAEAAPVEPAPPGPAAVPVEPAPPAAEAAPVEAAAPAPATVPPPRPKVSVSGSPFLAQEPVEKTIERLKAKAVSERHLIVHSEATERGALMAEVSMLFRRYSAPVKSVATISHERELDFLSDILKLEDSERNEIIALSDELFTAYRAAFQRNDLAALQRARRKEALFDKQWADGRTAERIIRTTALTTSMMFSEMLTDVFDEELSERLDITSAEGAGRAHLQAVAAALPMVLRTADLPKNVTPHPMDTPVYIPVTSLLASRKPLIDYPPSFYHAAALNKQDEPLSPPPPSPPALPYISSSVLQSDFSGDQHAYDSALVIERAAAKVAGSAPRERLPLPEQPEPSMVDARYIDPSQVQIPFSTRNMESLDAFLNAVSPTVKALESARAALEDQRAALAAKSNLGVSQYRQVSNRSTRGGIEAALRLDAAYQAVPRARMTARAHVAGGHNSIYAAEADSIFGSLSRAVTSIRVASNRTEAAAAAAEVSPWPGIPRRSRPQTAAAAVPQAVVSCQTIGIERPQSVANTKLVDSRPSTTAARPGTVPGRAPYYNTSTEQCSRPSTVAGYGHIRGSGDQAGRPSTGGFSRIASLSGQPSRLQSAVPPLTPGSYSYGLPKVEYFQSLNDARTFFSQVYGAIERQQGETSNYYIREVP